MVKSVRKKDKKEHPLQCLAQKLTPSKFFLPFLPQVVREEGESSGEVSNQDEEQN